MTMKGRLTPFWNGHTGPDWECATGALESAMAIAGQHERRARVVIHIRGQEQEACSQTGRENQQRSLSKKRSGETSHLAHHPERRCLRS